MEYFARYFSIYERSNEISDCVAFLGESIIGRFKSGV